MTLHAPLHGTLQQLLRPVLEVDFPQCPDAMLIAVPVRRRRWQIPCWPTPARQAAWANVGKQHGPMAAGSATTVAKAFSPNVTSGNLLVVWVAWGTPGGAEGPGTCADTVGTVYTEIAACRVRDATNSQSVSVFWGVAAGSGANTATNTFLAARTFRAIEVCEFSGNSATPLDGGIGQLQASATALTSTNFTTTVNGDIVIGFTLNTNVGTATLTCPDNTLDNTGATDGFASQWKTQATAGAIASTFTAGAAQSFITVVATFKLAAGGGAPPFVGAAANLNQIWRSIFSSGGRR